MCAVIGAVLGRPTIEQFNTLLNVFHESSIRGLHATGLSYVKFGQVHTIKEPISAKQFQFNFHDYINEDGNLYLVGHCRYSTSDLEFNQPIANSELSICHNGVVTQELPDHWKSLYGYDCETRNDSELLLHTVIAGKSPLDVWGDESLSVCELHSDKTLRVYRNGKRPLYQTKLENGFVFTSTKDIAARSGLPVDATTKLSLNEYVTVVTPDRIVTHIEPKPNQDLQAD